MMKPRIVAIVPPAWCRYGYYSNKSCGMRKKAGTDDQVPAWVESAISAVLTKVLTHKHPFDILICVKSKFLSFIFLFGADVLIGKLTQHMLIATRLFFSILG